MKTAKKMQKNSEHNQAFTQFKNDFDEDVQNALIIIGEMINPQQVKEYTRMNNEIFDNYEEYI